MSADDILVFGGSGSPLLTAKICDFLGIAPGKKQVLRFSEGNLFVRIKENVRGRRVYLVQSTAFPANDNFMEPLFWIDAFKRASVESVTVVMPYFSYAKGDKKDEPRVSIRARVCADAIQVAGADRVVTMDLHAAQIQGFFRVPVDDLYALPICEAIKKKGLDNLVVVSPDAGFAKKARDYASYLDAGLAIGDKIRSDNSENAEVMNIIGKVEGKTAVIVDDFTISAGTLISVAEQLLKEGVRDVYAAVTHGVFSSPEAMERIENSPLGWLLVTDTVENQPVQLSGKVEVVSVAPLFGKAIRGIHNRESISGLFDWQ